MFHVFFNRCLFSPLSATWASTTRPRCSTSETAPSTPWTDLSSSPMPSALPSGYTTCPCLKRPKQCSRFGCHHREQTKRRDMCTDNHMTPFLFYFFPPFFPSGAELQLTNRYRSPRVPLHLLPSLPASPTLHSHRQQHPAHHKRFQVPPACSSLHGFLGGITANTSSEKYNSFFVFN